ncbi:NUDIX domain-containing protein [Candidatus Gottesmanbacteria bacterium]|nr:NUDIX domain-containing protein [Candidatus Gottesmanbacteria bacterium]
MKRELSAGGVIVRKKGREWHVLLVRDMNGNWTFPKGLVEKGEDTLTCAKREIAEEVGMTNITLLKSLTPIRYLYQRNGLISKTVQYFLFTFDGNEVPTAQTEEGISEVQWRPFNEAIKTIGYSKTNKKLLEETQDILQKRQ